MLTRNKILAATALIWELSAAYAGSMGANTSSYHPLVTVFGGVANLKPDSGVSSFADSDDNLFIYHRTPKTTTAGFVGVFAGIETTPFTQKLLLQTGIEYNYFGKAFTKGLHTVGVEPETSTRYQYQYTLQTQQLLAVAKLFKPVPLPHTQQIIYPYVSVGLGAAFNKLKHYHAITAETGSINLTANFPNQTHSSFSYQLGVGLDYPVNEHARVGVGYKFSDFLKANLNKGRVVYNQYAYPVSFSLPNAHTDANQFVVQASYIL